MCVCVCVYVHVCVLVHVCACVCVPGLTCVQVLCMWKSVCVCPYIVHVVGGREDKMHFPPWLPRLCCILPGKLSEGHPGGKAGGGECEGAGRHAGGWAGSLQVKEDT